MFPTKFDLINDGKKVVDNFPQYERELQNSIVITFSNIHLVPNKPGIYAAWMNDKLVYVGSSENLKQRIKSHYSGQRGSDQFCLYVFDKFLLPKLCKENIKLSTKEINNRTAYWIRQNIVFRFIEVQASESLLKKLERKFRKRWKPLLNPLD